MWVAYNAASPLTVVRRGDTRHQTIREHSVLCIVLEPDVVESESRITSVQPIQASVLLANEGSMFQMLLWVALDGILVRCKLSKDTRCNFALERSRIQLTKQGLVRP